MSETILNRMIGFGYSKLAACYEYGIGTKPNLLNALEYYIKAYDHGHLRAISGINRINNKMMTELGDLTKENYKTMDIVKNPDKQWDWL